MARASVLAGASDTLFMVEAIVASQPVWLAWPSNNATGSMPAQHTVRPALARRNPAARASSIGGQSPAGSAANPISYSPDQ